MKLLFDQNLSHRLCKMLVEEFPSSAHVRDFGMGQACDLEIWEFAKANSYTIVSKDSDFHQRSFLLGHPPKVVWVRLGNAGTDKIAETLRRHVQDLLSFEVDPEAAFLVIS
ncbi:MAG: DUF5615 family PIN-like protein [Phycisphaerae bacterium]|nr:DUF5615 family PIN-like protein [Phycisphaerae bacterium]